MASRGVLTMQATSQSPSRSLDAITGYYTRDCANIHRGSPAQRASHRRYERADQSAALPNAASSHEIIFTRELRSVNLVAHSFVRPRLNPGGRDSDHDHGAPLQYCAVAARDRGEGAQLHVAPVDDRATWVMEEFERC